MLQVLQLRVKFEKDAEKQETMWENQHEHAAEKIYAMCSEMGGFFLKVFCLRIVISLEMGCFLITYLG